MYLTHFVYGAIEVPAKVGAYFALDRIGRRNGQAWSLIITGALIALNTAIPTGRLLKILYAHSSWVSGPVLKRFCHIKTTHKILSGDIEYQCNGLKLSCSST